MKAYYWKMLKYCDDSDVSMDWSNGYQAKPTTPGIEKLQCHSYDEPLGWKLLEKPLNDMWTFFKQSLITFQLAFANNLLLSSLKIKSKVVLLFS